MQLLQTFNVSPRLPEALEPLRELASNLWWTWEPNARRLFRQLDPELWDRTNHNPVQMLQLSRQARLHELAANDEYAREIKLLAERFRTYMGRADTYGKLRATAPRIAYFSAEFGFHESFPNYSGGLGILSGDHCKSASDLDLDFTAMTLLYRHGYFKQQINKEGWQDAISLNQHFHHLAISETKLGDQPLFVSVEMLGRNVLAKVWELRVGRIILYLLDTDILQNTPEDRPITSQLYGGDTEMRIRQEIVLGIGGIRALDALQIRPDVYHMNEGHSAFLSLERIRRYVHHQGLEYYPALQVVAASNVFTTHTPVPAGNDAFPRGLMAHYFSSYAEEFRISFDDFFRLGQQTINSEDTFSMTILALKTSRYANGVSKLHGEVSRTLWKDVWAGVPVEEVPITSITNGIHTKTWTAPEFHQIYAKYLGPNWDEFLTDPEYWRRVIDIPDDVLWETHQLLKVRLIDFIRSRIRTHRTRLGESPDQLRKVNSILNPDILTIGFARRFATYKRGALLFRNKERLLRMISNVERPVQFIFAGKAHPKDEPGKRLIQEVYQLSRQPEFENAIVFIEDYDTYIGRRMTQGVDLWLNTPTRPLEASGTSGMKLPPNGGLNFSVLDGWWCEGYNRKNGWPIGPEISEGAPEFQNQVDAESLFNILENQIVPLYYAKPDGRLPLAWIQLMRESIRSVTPVFNTHRMVKEYTERLYEPAAAAHKALTANQCAAAVDLARWKHATRVDWPQIRIEAVETSNSGRVSMFVGDKLHVSARVYLGSVKPEHVKVQAYVGAADDGTLANPNAIDLYDVEKAEPKGFYVFRGVIPAFESGSYGFNVRVIPTHPLLSHNHELRLITWAA
ncbi:MAG: alpha-glucan family phosphorylase [Verrucomicrobia bacterium]|nr:alpha-glucan family phosphorylase [Verrucomicrobiota bacterium]MBV9671284.1 alpha-glucan family phosphorylase [Verrucomicrobiota bacterium]